MERAFCVAGLTVWNSLPESRRSADSISSFKQQLKTHVSNLLFRCFFVYLQNGVLYNFGRLCLYICMSDDNFRKL